MSKSNKRFSKVSLSGAVLLLGCAVEQVSAENCDQSRCLTTFQENIRMDDGSSLQVGTGGSIVNSMVINGRLRVWDSGSVIGTTVNGNNGWLEINDSASAQDSLLNNGQMVVVGSATAQHTTVNNGNLDVAKQASVSDTQLNGGSMWVFNEASATDTRVSNSQMTVYENAHVQDTTVNDGGVMSVFDSAFASDIVVNDGGLFEVDSGTTVHNTTVNQGGLMAMADRAEASNTSINQGGVLQLKGDAILGENTHVDGQVSFADPAISGFHTLFVKGPLSGNGTFMMNTDLADLRGDLIKVQGEISGNHTLVVADSGKAPANPYALALVDGNGGHGSFSLYGKTVDAGAFRYELQHVGEDWYLMNSADVDPINDPDGSKIPPVDPVTPVTPIDPTTPVNPVTPVNPQEKPAIPAELAKPAQPVHRPQAQTLSKGANAAVASHAASAALISAQMSATLGHFGELRSGKDQGGLWTRGYGAEQHLDTGASRAFDQQINGFEVGADKAMSFADGTLYVGALFGQGKGRQSFGEASKGTTDSTTLGGYASYLDRSGLYVDGTVKYSRLDNETKITSNLGNKVKAKFKNHAVTADVQVGKHIDLSQGWFVEPQAGLQVTRISGSRYAASNGLTVEQDAMLSVQSRIGGVVGRDMKLDNGMTVKPYAKANWITEHAGKSNVKVSGAKLDSRLPGSRAEIGGGVMISVADKHNLYAEATYTKGRGIEQPMAVTVGYRYTW